MPRSYNQPVGDQEFVQRVRRHSPSTLIPLIANIGSQFNEKDAYAKQGARQYAPWVLAEVARVSLIYGNEYRSPATSIDLWECCRACEALADPELQNRVPEAIGRFLLRIADQLTYQQPIYNDLARTAAFFTQTQARKPLKVATEGWEGRLLGCALNEYIGAAFVLYAGALKNSGTLDLQWLRQPQFDEASQEVPVDVLESVIATHYAATIDELKKAQHEAEKKAGTSDGNYRRFGFNPLWGRPTALNFSDLRPLSGDLTALS